MPACRSPHPSTRSDIRPGLEWTHAARPRNRAPRDDGTRFSVAQIRADIGISTDGSTMAKTGVRRTMPRCVAAPMCCALRRASRSTANRSTGPGTGRGGCGHA